MVPQLLQSFLRVNDAEQWRIQDFPQGTLISEGVRQPIILQNIC